MSRDDSDDGLNNGAEHTLSVQCKNCLDSHIYASKVVPLKHDLAHMLPVLDGIDRRLGEEDLSTGRVDLHLLAEGVVPEMLHVIPPFDDAVVHLHRRHTLDKTPLLLPR